MCLGLSLAYLGEARLLKQIWPYLNETVIPVEEAHLKEVFRDEYERYTARVRRWIQRISCLPHRDSLRSNRWSAFSIAHSRRVPP